MKSLLLLFIVFCLIGCGSGANGPAGADGLVGPQGEAGQAGEDGTDGEDGKSCSVQQNQLGALITCPDGTSALILHGRNAGSQDCRIETRCFEGKHHTKCHKVKICETR